jgi:lysyl-tRNA synthetase class 2
MTSPPLPPLAPGAASGRSTTGPHTDERPRPSVEPSRAASAGVCTLIALVVAVTAAVRADLVSADALASSPYRLAQGKLWLLLSNGLLVQRPVLLSLVSFALLALFTLFFCGSRVVVAATLAGHVGSTLLAYALVAALYSLDTEAARTLVNLPDYGVSAMQAAWVGAIAATVWRRRGQSGRGRVLVAAGCLAVAAFAWLVRGDLTLLDVDHLFAFAFGAGFAVGWGSRQTQPLPAATAGFLHRLLPPLPAAPEGGRLPLAAATLVGLLALVNLQSAASPNIHWRSRLLRQVVPDSVLPLSHALAIPLSAALLLAAVSLARRRRRAWQAALGFLLGLAVLDLLKGLSYEQSAVSLAGAAFLAWARPAFVVAPDPRSLRSSANLAAVFIAGTIALATAATWVSLPGAPNLALVLRESRALLLWEDGPVHFQHALRDFPRAINLLSLGGLLCALWMLFRPLCPPPWLPERASRRRACQLVRAYGRDTLAFFKLRRDLQYLFSPDRRAFLGYRIEGGVLLVAGDPVGAQASIPALLEQTRRLAARHGLRLAVLGASEQLLPLYRRAGLRAFYLGDEAIIDTRTFTLQGRPIRKVRQSVHRLERLGYQVELVHADDLTRSELAELEQVSAAHLGAAAERGFSMALDALRPDDAGETPIVLGRGPDGRVAGFLHYVPSYGRAAVSLAAMRRLRGTPNGLTEYLVSRSLELLREQGIEQVSLNFSLLGRYLRQPETFSQRLLAVMLRRLGRWFQIESLYRFNAKFFPRWQPRYLVFQGVLGLPATALAALWIEGQIPRPPRARRRRSPSGQAASATR